MSSLRFRSRLAVAAAALAVLGGCAALPGAPGALACERGDRRLVRDTLYFGRNRPGGGTVGEAEWRSFLDGTITPRFPDGLTVTHAGGQWRGASGAIEREETEVVTVLHAGDAAARGRIAEIAAAYKSRFGQEAVLRERSLACASF